MKYTNAPQGLGNVLRILGDPDGHTLISLVTKWGDIARSLDLILGARWDGAGDLGTDITAVMADLTILETRLSAARAGYLDQLDFNLQETIAALQTDLDNPDQYKANIAALALEATLGTHDTDIKALLATIAAYLDTEIAAILADTEDMQPKLGIPAADLAADIAAIKAVVDAIPAVAPFEQLCPILMNAPRTANEAALTNAAGNKEFIPTNTIAASNLYSTDDSKVSKVTLIIIGRAVNTHAGSNALDCTTPAHNQWQMSLGAGAYTDLTNEVADGQMLDNDWLCPVEGAIHPFTFAFDITTEMTDIDGHIGVQLLNGRAEQTSLIITCDIYLKVVWLP